MRNAMRYENRGGWHPDVHREAKRRHAKGKHAGARLRRTQAWHPTRRFGCVVALVIDRNGGQVPVRDAAHRLDLIGQALNSIRRSLQPDCKSVAMPVDGQME